MMALALALLAVVTLVAAVGPATGYAEGRGELHAVQVGGECSDVRLTAEGLPTGERVRLVVSEPGQHTASEVPSSSRLVGETGDARWEIPASELPVEAACGDEQLSFTVMLMEVDGKLRQRVAGPVNIQRGPAPGIVGHGPAGIASIASSDRVGDPVALLWAIAAFGAVVGARLLVGAVSPRSRR